jgi:4-carboxymuconolactone decarboxylase
MPRLRDIDPATLSAEQRAVYDAMIAGPRGRVQGPLRIWLSSPTLADKAQQLGAFCRFGSSLPPRLSELAILVTGAHWKSSFEFYAHAPLGINGGLDAAAVEAIRVGAEPHFDKEDEAIVYRFAREAWATKRVSDATYRAAVSMLGERAVVELTGIIGYYAMVSLTLNVFEVGVPDGERDPFAA